MSYLTERYQKIVKKHGGFQEEKVNSNRTENANDVCFKCGKQDHFIRDFPIHKGENKKCVKSGGDKNKSRDLVPGKSSKTKTVDYDVNEALAVKGDSSSDFEESYYPKNVSMLVSKGDEDVFDAVFCFDGKI